jgi:hypothetical protein
MRQRLEERRTSTELMFVAPKFDGFASRSAEFSKQEGCVTWGTLWQPSSDTQAVITRHTELVTPPTAPKIHPLTFCDYAEPHSRSLARQVFEHEWQR